MAGQHLLIIVSCCLTFIMWWTQLLLVQISKNCQKIIPRKKYWPCWISADTKTRHVTVVPHRLTLLFSALVLDLRMISWSLRQGLKSSPQPALHVQRCSRQSCLCWLHCIIQYYFQDIESLLAAPRLWEEKTRPKLLPFLQIVAE